MAGKILCLVTSDVKLKRLSKICTPALQKCNP